MSPKLCIHRVKLITCSLLIPLVAIFCWSSQVEAKSDSAEFFQDAVVTSEIEQLAAQLGMDPQLVADMLKVGIPADHINPELVDEFLTEMRPEYLFPEPETSLERSEITAAAINAPSAVEALSASIETCDAQNFPFVFLNIRVEDDGVPVTDLTADNIQCSEDNVVQTDFFSVTPPQTGGNVRLADIVFIIDTSGSMQDEITAVRDNANAFAQALDASDVDFRLGLVSFGNTLVDNPFVFNNGNLTGSVDTFQSFVGQLSANGSFEPGFLAITSAIQDFNFRPGAQKIFIVITDEDSDGTAETSQESTIDLLQANEVTVHTAVLCTAGSSEENYCDETSVRGATGGLLFDVVGPYDQILDTIVSRTAATYVVRYRSSNDTFDGVTRAISCQISDNNMQDTVGCSYAPGAAPRIARTAETIALDSTSSTAGQPITISADVIDDVAPPIQDVTLFYRTTGSTVYTSSPMTLTNNNRYEATIPSISAPGIDYYFRATDGQISAQLPSTDPGNAPFQIAVLPNVAPAISHTPRVLVEENTDLDISATVFDNTNTLVSVELKWRYLGNLTYNSNSMTEQTNGIYTATIPNTQVNQAIEYYIRAVDDFGLASTSGTSDMPYLVEISAVDPIGTLGDVNCDSNVNTTDALYILQFEVGLISDIGRCPQPQEIGIYAALGDVDNSGSITAVDALFILQCEINVANTLCPTVTAATIHQEVAKRKAEAKLNELLEIVRQQELEQKIFMPVIR